ncbi:MAG: YhgE/Pip family protein, partial [Propionibacteriaceae bacterium]|nr:YhgE/Pip family protein [Propionibacteriaceae bacterium]
MTTSIAPAGSSGSSGSAGRTGPAVLPHQRTLITVLAMALGPIALMALLTWAFWHPTTRLAQLDAAVVNLDEPVTVNGEHMPLGRQLAAELVGGSSHLDSTYNWVITTAEDAAKGLREGTYVALVTIPEGFSAAATSSAGAPVDARRAMIEVATSTRAAQFDDVISRVVVDAAVRALSNQVTSGYLSGVYFGFTTLKDGLTSATDGAWRLADGTGQAVDGAVQLDSGAGQLVAGADQLARGSRTVANGVAELSSQVDRQLVAAAPQLRGGIVRLNDGLQQMKTAAPQLRQVADPLGEGADAVSKWAEGLEGDAGAQAEFLVSLVEACRETADDAFCDRVRDFLSNALGDPDVAQALNQFLDCLGQAADEVGAFADQMGDLADGLEQAAAGSAELERKTRDYVAGVNALGRGARDTAGGTAQVAVGAQQLADWLRELKSGTKQAADGSRELDAGANELASGLADARDQVPSYSDSEQSKLQAAVSQPIVAEQAGFEG